MIDLTKLTPAPFFLNRFGEVCYGNEADESESFSVYEHDNPEDDKLFVLARNAFDVMMRRHWMPVYDATAAKEGYPPWCVQDESFNNINCSLTPGTKNFPLYHDPFTALHEADKWYKANVEDAK